MGLQHHQIHERRVRPRVIFVPAAGSDHDLLLRVLLDDVQFQPKEMANQLRDYGSFIPGLRPGKRTSDYLEKVMMRITYVGAAFLCVIAVVPTAISASLDINYLITAFLGGTGLLIVVSLALDMVQRIEANLLMRNYGGFLSGPGGGKGPRIKGRQY